MLLVRGRRQDLAPRESSTVQLFNGAIENGRFLVNALDDPPKGITIGSASDVPKIVSSLPTLKHLPAFSPHILGEAKLDPDCVSEDRLPIPAVRCRRRQALR
jgi:hypothetical protein